MYIKKFDRAQINFKRMIMLAILITTVIVGLLGTVAKADINIINYENRPGSMIVKDNYGTILSVLNSGKITITEAGKAYFVVNTDTVGKVYLINKSDNTTKFVITSKYFRNHRATLHMLTDSDGILTNVSVTLDAYNGFIHSIDVMEFVSMVEKNLEAGIESAEAALEAAIQLGAEAATVEALEAAVAEAIFTADNWIVDIYAGGEVYPEQSITFEKYTEYKDSTVADGAFIYIDSGSSAIKGTEKECDGDNCRSPQSE